MPPSKRFVCIHGHFYQPPRENPWLETVETQDSAAPYHDWNERICAECYATERRGAHPERKKPDHAHREQLRAHELQLWADAAELAEGQCAANAPHDCGWRAAEPAGATRGTARRWRRFTTTSSCRWRTGAIGLRRSGGALRTINITTARRRRECGWRRRRRTPRRWNCWRRTGSSSRCWRRTSASGFGR